MIRLKQICAKNIYLKALNVLARAMKKISLTYVLRLAKLKLQLMKLRLIYRIFSQKARARTFAHIRSKPKNACNLHIFEFACKKQASYDNAKLFLYTV